MKRIVVAAGLIKGTPDTPEANRFLLSQRPAHTHLEFWWEFPGGKVEAGESPPSALKRELREELGIDVAVHDIYAVGHHVYPEREVILLVFEATHVSGKPRCIGVKNFEWLTAAEVIELDLPPADEPVIARLRREYL